MLSAPGPEAWKQLLGGNPLVLFLDELPPYLEYAVAVPVGNADLGVVTTAALANLFVAVADMENVCLVLSDMAHNTVGHRATDHLKIIALIEIAADFAIRTLKPGGHFVSKNFQGGDAGGVLAQLRAEFETAKYVKPESSRKDSAEVFLVAMNKR